MSNTTTDDRIAQLETAADRAVEVVWAIEPSQLGEPTPCGELDVHNLVGHLLFAMRRAEMLGRGVDAFANPPAEFEQRPPWPVVAEMRAVADALVEAWKAEDLAAPMTLPWATMPAGAVLDTYVMEIVVHTWDLAVATGQPSEADPWLAEALYPGTKAMMDALGGAAYSGDVPPFQRPTEPPADAGPHACLAALMGRKVDASMVSDTR